MPPAALAHPQQRKLLDRRGHVNPAWSRYFAQRPGAAPEPNASVFPYRIDALATGASDPGAGHLRYNATPQAGATALYVDWLTADDFDAHVLYQLLQPTSRILIQDADLAANYQVWALTGPAVNMPDWFQVPVTFVSGSGAVEFAHNQRVVVLR